MLNALLTRKLPGLFGVPPESFVGLDGGETFCGIIFCLWAQGEFGATEVAAEAKRLGFSAASYSGGPPRDWGGSAASWKEHKIRVEREFKKNGLALLASTNAFGMGIDKPNVRYTVHYGIPRSIEAFYQEAGRAGRDRRPAVCCVIVSDEYVSSHDAMLRQDTSVEEVGQVLKEMARSENDDVTRALYFQTQAFPGIERELDVLKKVLAQLDPLDEEHVAYVSMPEDLGSGDGRGRCEKALHRLVTLGVISDYLVDYSNSTFEVRLSGFPREMIIRAYADHVAGYSSSLEVAERAEAEALPSSSLSDLVVAMAGLYLRFVYRMIEWGRRRALSEMLAACRSGEDAFRGRVLRYLESTEHSARLDKIVESKTGGLPGARELMGEIISSRDADALRGEVARYLESYPDHPALLALRAFAEAATTDTDWRAVDENLGAFLHNAAGPYRSPRAEVFATAAYLLRVLEPRDEFVFFGFQRRVLRAYPDRESARELVRAGGLRAAPLAAWTLLNGLAGDALKVCHS